MAAEFVVFGPSTVRYNSITIGRTDADGASAQIINGARPVYTSEKGPHIPAAIINHGRFAKVAVTLVEWERSSATGVEAMLGRGRGAKYASIGTIGANILGCATTLVISGSTRQFSATKAIIMDDDINIREMGTNETRIDVVFTCFPSGTASSSICFTIK